MDLLLSKSYLRRRTEELDYWRKRAGWYDDDVSMQDYNSGVSYYDAEDDDNVKQNSNSAAGSGTGLISEGLATFLKIGAVVLAVIAIMLLYRALSRRKASARKVSSSANSKESKHRTRSRSRSSRSRSRSKRPSSGTGNYELMDEKSEKSSKRSSRSRSRSRKHSKSRKSRSASKSRVVTKEILV